MEVLGTTDPFFSASLDDRLSYMYVSFFCFCFERGLQWLEFRSSVQSSTLTPVWNEVWQVKNVPTTAVLSVILRDKDHRTPIDSFIGKFETTIYPGAKEAELQGPMVHMRNRGTFWLKVAECI